MSSANCIAVLHDTYVGKHLMYTTWISDDDSRVKVAGFDTDYINANYIDARLFFILTLLSLKHD